MLKKTIEKFIWKYNRKMFWNEIEKILIINTFWVLILHSKTFFIIKHKYFKEKKLLIKVITRNLDKILKIFK